MDFSMVCRTCLSTNNLHPIISNAEDIYLTTGVKIHINDGLPQNICEDCTSFVDKSVTFRKLCDDAQVCLLNLKKDYDDNKCRTDTLDSKETNVVRIYQDGDDGKTELVEKSFFFDEVIEGLDSDNKEKDIITCFDIEMDSRTIKDKEMTGESKTNSKLSFTENDKVKEHETQSETQRITKAKFKKKARYKKLGGNDAELPYYVVFDANAKRQRVSCKLCQKNLSIRSIDAHVDNCHPGADPRKVKCELCDDFFLKEKLQRHNLVVHGAKSFRCRYCMCEFDSAKILIDHVADCTLKKKKPRASGESARVMVKCDICNKEMQKASLRMHKLITHAGLGPVCKHCDKRMGNKYRLNEHYRAKHGYQKLKCTYCEFQSASAMAIRDHERRHRGEKPFVCECCGSNFHAAYLLTQHKQIHRIDKQYKCDKCPAMFKANNNLHMHKYTCHSNDIYRCGVCSRSYSCRQYAVKHIRRVHKILDRCPPVLRDRSDI